MNLRRTFKKGGTIFHQGNPSDCAFIISSGSVEIVENTREGEKIIGRLTENDIFGEMGLIDGQPRSATARALEDSVMYIMTRNNFDNLAKENPEALLPILKILTGRLRETMKYLKLGIRPSTNIKTEPTNRKLTTY
ncbi:MAG: cyclic nucleotide-binding domain-containing protein [Nitrospinae bacterium]|nr:cyclic nucleotide-binding domain-containing protein [Nitrospinota bacterium]